MSHVDPTRPDPTRGRVNSRATLSYRVDKQTSTQTDADENIHLARLCYAGGQPLYFVRVFLPFIRVVSSKITICFFIRESRHKNTVHLQRYRHE